MPGAIRIREGTAADSYAAFMLFEETLFDLQVRMGQQPEVRYDDAEKLAAMWDLRKRLYDHQLVRADRFWLAEQDGAIIGLARSVPHNGVRELTEFFVKPDAQAAGVGRQLFDRAFPDETGVGRVLLATLEVPAQVRYIKAGLLHRFLVMYLGKKPQPQPVSDRLVAEPLTDTPQNRALLDELDRELIGFSHPNVHDYLLADRKGFKYTRPGGEIIGYGYVGAESGPFALRNPAAYPEVLSHAEHEAAQLGFENFGLEVPTVNTTALGYLLARQYRLDRFMGVLMSDFELPAAQNYLLPSPPFSI